MRVFLFAVAGLAIVACRNTSDAVTPSPEPPSASDNYVKVSFDGHSHTYRGAHLALGQLGTLKGLDITASEAGVGDLSLWVFGDKAGTFPYRPAMNQYQNVSQVEYRVENTVYAHYKALVCPTTAGYYATPGQVVITEYVPGQRIRGTFSGALLDQNDPDQCSKQGKAFSGEFVLNKL